MTKDLMKNVFDETSQEYIKFCQFRKKLKYLFKRKKKNKNFLKKTLFKKSSLILKKKKRNLFISRLKKINKIFSTKKAFSTRIYENARRNLLQAYQKKNNIKINQKLKFVQRELSKIKAKHSIIRKKNVIKVKKIYL